MGLRQATYRNEGTANAAVLLLISFLFASCTKFNIDEEIAQKFLSQQGVEEVGFRFEDPNPTVQTKDVVPLDFVDAQGEVTVASVTGTGFYDVTTRKFVAPRDAGLVEVTLVDELGNQATMNVNVAARTRLVPGDTMFNSLYGMHSNIGDSNFDLEVDIDGPEAWAMGVDCSNVVIGVIDTGVDFTHPDLVDNMWRNPGEDGGTPGVDDDGNGYVDDIFGMRFYGTFPSDGGSGPPMDDNGHGTHCSGTIAGVGDNAQGVTGVCWNAQIMALKFLHADTQIGGSTGDAIEAIDYATDNGAKLTSNSWGGTGNVPQSLNNAIARARNAGLLFVAAAGNGGQDGIGDNNDVVPNSPSNSTHNNVIAVAALNNNNTRAGFSNFGSNTVDVGAPGVGILSSLPGGYGSASGTSMATPHVAGQIAALYSMFPDLTHIEAKERTFRNVDPIPAMSGITVTGGRPNLWHMINDTAAGTGRLSLMHVTNVQINQNATTVNVSADFVNIGDQICQNCTVSLRTDGTKLTVGTPSSQSLGSLAPASDASTTGNGLRLNIEPGASGNAVFQFVIESNGQSPQFIERTLTIN